MRALPTKYAPEVAPRRIRTKKYNAHVRNNGARIAWPAIREATICQKLIAIRNAAASATGAVATSVARQYSATTVRVPATAAGIRNAALVFPKRAIDTAAAFAYNPSRPLFSA